MVAEHPSTVEQEKQVFLLLGSNLGDRDHNLASARNFLSTNCGPIESKSAIYLSAAWGMENQGDFYNQVIIIKTRLTAQDLLDNILSIEKEIGRTRVIKWGARIIDIDILFYGHEIIQTASLTVPHPRIAERNFTLVPLMELSPGLMHPILGTTIEELYLRTADTLDVIMIEN